MDFRLDPSLRETLRRWCAGAAAALVLILGILSVCPNLHHGLHHGDAVQHEETCAVTLFAAGVALDAAPLEVAPQRVEWAQRFFVHQDVFVPAPRYLHRPERGPPTKPSRLTA